MNTSTLQNINIGVDKGKSQLDIYVWPHDIIFLVSNDGEEKNVGQDSAQSLYQYLLQPIVVGLLII